MGFLSDCMGSPSESKLGDDMSVELELLMPFFSHGIGVSSAPPRLSSLPSPASYPLRLSELDQRIPPPPVPLPKPVTTFVRVLSFTVPGRGWACGRGKMSAVLETETTRSTARNHAGRVL